jgi:hypothetical protein
MCKFTNCKKIFKLKITEKIRYVNLEDLIFNHYPYDINFSECISNFSNFWPAISALEVDFKHITQFNEQFTVYFKICWINLADGFGVILFKI